MKKIVALMLCLALLCSACVSFASESSAFLVNFLGNVTMTAEEWYATEGNRENLAAAAVLEAVMQDIDPAIAFEAMAKQTVYVALDDDIVSVFYCGNEEILYFAYLPSLTAGVFNNIEYTSDADMVMAGLHEGGSFAEYTKVNAEIVQALIENILSE